MRNEGSMRKCTGVACASAATQPNLQSNLEYGKMYVGCRSEMLASLFEKDWTASNSDSFSLSLAHAFVSSFSYCWRDSILLLGWLGGWNSCDGGTSAEESSFKSLSIKNVAEVSPCLRLVDGARPKTSSIS